MLRTSVMSFVIGTVAVRAANQGGDVGLVIDQIVGLEQSATLFEGFASIAQAQVHRADAAVQRFASPCARPKSPDVIDAAAPRKKGDDMTATPIEIRVTELRQLFNSMDASPFGHRDLDPRAEELIVSWAREFPLIKPLGLRVHLDRPPGPPDESALLSEAIHGFFRERAEASRRSLRNLFRVGRTSLIVGLGFLALTVGASDLIADRSHGSLGETLREGLAIVGWVALWRPLEIFLYDWWPIRRQIRLAERLAVMPIEVNYGGGK
jgi:hypothetical protein